MTVRRGAVSGRNGVEWSELTDLAAVEEPLTLRVEGRAVAVLMRTPGHDRELAAGFLLTEGVVRSREEIFEISLCPSLNGSGDSVDVLLRDGAAWDPESLSRHLFTSSSCGICSKSSLSTAIAPESVLPVATDPMIRGERLAVLPDLLRKAQPGFAATGGLHGCAWWEPDHDRLAEGMVFEDVGRHNALDKLLGRALLRGRLPLERGILLLSGRISFELVQKSHAARIPVIAAVGAPSTLAVSYAGTAGITLCGFIRPDRVNVYSHPARIA